MCNTHVRPRQIQGNTHVRRYNFQYLHEIEIHVDMHNVMLY